MGEWPGGTADHCEDEDCSLSSRQPEFFISKPRDRFARILDVALYGRPAEAGCPLGRKPRPAFGALVRRTERKASLSKHNSETGVVFEKLPDARGATLPPPADKPRPGGTNVRHQ
jgi:hypothetical protein